MTVTSQNVAASPNSTLSFFALVIAYVRADTRSRPCSTWLLTNCCSNSNLWIYERKKKSLN